MINGIIFDWIGTLYERDKGLFSYSERVLERLREKRENGLRKYRFGLISLAKYSIESRLKELNSSGILYYFDSVIVDTTKTSEHYLKCMKEMATIPGTTAIVDDRTIRGIKVGNQLCCTTFWIQRGEHAHEVPNEETGEPTYKINTIEDLLKIL